MYTVVPVVADVTADATRLLTGIRRPMRMASRPGCRRDRPRWPPLRPSECGGFRAARNITPENIRNPPRASKRPPLRSGPRATTNTPTSDVSASGYPLRAAPSRSSELRDRRNGGRKGHRDAGQECHPHHARTLTHQHVEQASAAPPSPRAATRRQTEATAPRSPQQHRPGEQSPLVNVGGVRSHRRHGQRAARPHPHFTATAIATRGRERRRNLTAPGTARCSATARSPNACWVRSRMTSCGRKRRCPSGNWTTTAR